MCTSWAYVHLVSICAPCEYMHTLWVYAHLVSICALCGYMHTVWVQRVCVHLVSIWVTCGFMHTLWVYVHLMSIFAPCEYMCTLRVYAHLLSIFHHIMVTILHIFKDSKKECFFAFWLHPKLMTKKNWLKKFAMDNETFLVKKSFHPFLWLLLSLDVIYFSCPGYWNSGLLGTKFRTPHMEADSHRKW